MKLIIMHVEDSFQYLFCAVLVQNKASQALSNQETQLITFLLKY